MRKVLILSWFHPHKWSWVEKVSWKIWEKLSKKYKVIYFFMDLKKIYIEKDNIKYCGFNATKIPILNNMLYILKTLFFIKKNKPDIIIDNWGYSSLYNLFYHKIKIIGILHWTCLAFIKKVKYPNIVDKIKHFLYFWIMSLFEKNMIKKSDYSVLLSKHIKDEIENYYKIYRNDYIYIYNGYDVIYKQDFLQKDLKENVNIIFVSNAHNIKGINILEKVAKNLKNDNVLFQIIGAKYTSKQKNIKYLWKARLSLAWF